MRYVPGVSQKCPDTAQPVISRWPMTRVCARLAGTALSATLNSTFAIEVRGKTSCAMPVRSVTARLTETRESARVTP